MITLAIDASTYTGTVAVLRGDDVVADADAAMRGRDSEALMPAVAAVLARAEVVPREIERVVCGAGPGSFTSLRIAASIAKGLSFGAGGPLFVVSSLALIGAGAALPGRYLAVLDALRGDAYVGGYSMDTDGQVTVIRPDALTPQSDVAAIAESLGATTIGPGQTIDRLPHARGVRALEAMMRVAGPVAVASWEPRYGRKAEAQTRWEATHGRALPSSEVSP